MGGLPSKQPHLVSFLYVILCGLVAASPSCCLRQSSYSEKLPSKNVTLLSPSNARMWVATRSRNQRSWEMTMAQPANCSIASSRARRVLTSRSFVGSSRRRTLAPSFRRDGVSFPHEIQGGLVSGSDLVR